MSVTVIVPTHNGVNRIGLLLDSLDGDTEVIVVDNASTDGTRALLARRYPDVDVLSLPRNEGFSRAVNRAAGLASGDVLVLINDDCVCESAFIEHIAGALDAAAGIVMSAAVMLDARQPLRIDSAGIELDDTMLVFDYLNGMHVGVLECDLPQPLGPSGAAGAFDRDAFLDAGGFDEQLFAYWEDVDLALRLRRAGAKCALVTDARTVHTHSSTLGSGSPRKNYLTGYGRGYLLRKWRVPGAPPAAIVARDVAICVGQLAVDHNLSGLRGRLDGWRAGRGLSPLELPDGLRPRRGVGEEISRRARRRHRLKAEAIA